MFIARWQTLFEDFKINAKVVGIKAEIYEMNNA
jgi:hypothetical protein